MPEIKVIPYLIIFLMDHTLAELFRKIFDIEQRTLKRKFQQRQVLGEFGHSMDSAGLIKKTPKFTYKHAGLIIKVPCSMSIILPKGLFFFKETSNK